MPVDRFTCSLGFKTSICLSKSLHLLQDVVELASLFADGLGLIANSKAAVVRLGLAEMITLSKLLEPSNFSFDNPCLVRNLTHEIHSEALLIFS